MDKPPNQNLTFFLSIIVIIVMKVREKADIKVKLEEARQRRLMVEASR